MYGKGTGHSSLSTSIFIAQVLGLPLYIINKNYHYAYVAMSKRLFGILCNTLTSWFSPTLLRVSGDASVRGQLRLTKDGLLETDFPERIVLIANHQVRE